MALGVEDGPGSLTSVDAEAIRTKHGEYVVRGMYVPSMAVFDASGRYVRTIGRDGGAPGEYRGIASVAPYRRDSLLVLDWGTQRFSVLGPTLAYARGGALPFIPGLSTVALSDGSFVHHVHRNTPELVGLPLHRLSPDGSLLGSFGSATGRYRPDIPHFTSRTVAAANASSVWVAPLTAYEIERIDAVSGRVERRLLRNVPWFADGRTPRFVSSAPDRPPPPLLVGLRQAPDGLLWVLAAVPDANWRAQVQTDRGSHGFRILDEQGYYDTIIEVIDPSSGALLASQRVDQYLRQFVDDHLVGTVIEDADTGIPRLQVWEVRLVRP